MSTSNARTTVSVSVETKSKMDKWRAPGQCYDGFLCEMMNLWERMHQRNTPQKSISGRSSYSAGS
jgi:hypothetical protein